VAVLIGAADTYVVVVALPSIMTGVGVGLDRLQRAAPIVSGFLLGYTVMLPLIGRLADLRGTDPMFRACLVIFGVGSLVTATAHSLPVAVTGRAIQGVGGGGLVPVTLAMVAERWPADRRGKPLGVIGALQELGSVVGPLYGAAVIAVASWRAIFWINVPIVVLVALGYRLAGRDEGRSAIGSSGEGRRHARRAGGLKAAAALLVVAGVAALAVALDSPASLATSASFGQWFAPHVGGTWAAFTTPATLSAAGLLVLGGLLAVGGTAWSSFRHAGKPHIHDRSAMRQPLRHLDVPGAALLAGVLSCLVVAFSTADPSRHVVASSAPVLVPAAVVLAASFWMRQRTARSPLVPAGAMRRRPAWGGLAVNLFTGAALMAALVDIPLFARATVDTGSETGAALVLLRFLVAVPVGALAGGALCRRREMAAPVAAGGLALATASFLEMTRWSPSSLGGAPRPSDVVLAAAGLGFGLAIAPVNVAVLGAVEPGLHALASALAVVARTVGMVAGLSALTAVALRRFYQAQSRIGSPLTLCPAHPTACPAYDRATTTALVSELHTVFFGAAVCAAVAAVLAVLLLRPETAPRGARPAPMAAAPDDGA
jgi:MFS family permease